VDAVHWSRYLDGEFSSAKCRRCEEHLAGCAECRGKLRDVRRTVQALQAAAHDAIPPAVRAVIRQRARAALRGQQSPARPTRGKGTKS
jgi:anti-sigma factor RsiW